MRKQSDIECQINGHNRSVSTFRTDENERVTVATCRRCGSRLGVISHG